MTTPITRAATDKAELFRYYWRLVAIGYLPPRNEYNFDKDIGRKHRFDFAWPESMVAVEINGNAWNTKGGGRHGKDSDLEKMNIAVSLGWRVFQFSPAMIKSDPQRWIDMVKSAIDNA